MPNFTFLGSLEVAQNYFPGVGGWVGGLVGGWVGGWSYSDIKTHLSQVGLNWDLPTGLKMAIGVH